MQVSGRLLIATHLEQSNKLSSQLETGWTSSEIQFDFVYWTVLGPRLSLLKGPSSLPVDSFVDSTYEPHPRFFCAG
jgi:hypothetical protein